MAQRTRVLASLVLVLGCCAACVAQRGYKVPEYPRRTISGKTVDLTALYEWEKLSKKLGQQHPVLPERPFPAWDSIYPRTVIRSDARGILADCNAYRFEAQGSRKTRVVLLIKNVPADLDDLSHPVRWYALKVGNATTSLAKGTEPVVVPVYDHGLVAR